MSVQIDPKLFNRHKNDYGNLDIILGSDPGLLDSLHNNHPEGFTIYKTLRKQDWPHDEFDLSNCKVEFQTNPKPIYNKMIRTLAWQWEADSIASRSIVNVLSNVVTDSHIWTGYVRINDNENVHALTYSEIVRASFDNPSEILDEVLKVEEAHARMEIVARTMSTGRKAALRYALGERENDQSLYNDIFMYLVALYFLERVQFMSSFAMTFALDQAGYFKQIATPVQKIAQDEFEIHAQFGQYVLKQLLKSERGLRAFRECRGQIITLLWEILITEGRWVKYLFSDGYDLPGVNAVNTTKWSLYNGFIAGDFFGITDDLIATYGDQYEAELGIDFKRMDRNPLMFMQNYLDISSIQRSIQEEDPNDYASDPVDRSNEADEFDVEF